ncbi:unnamed protein product [Arabidopsis thaliana]|uniref:(thale cress) hypothetical protein n=1 Tax=Arabidopsis thaliana TaxID=3702 RepID=A0A7G2EVF6_ARATH|nr:unnamed protein product [Arabidopsis thaliana]
MPKMCLKKKARIEVRVFWFDDLDAPKAKGESSRWVMHEYKITSLPHLNLDSYVLYKIVDKRSKKADITNGNTNNSSDPSQSLVSDSNTIKVTSIPTEVEQLGTAQHLLSDQEMQEKYRSSHDPVRAINTAPGVEQPGKESVYGLTTNDLSVPINEQDDLLPRNSYKGTSSPGDNVGSSNRKTRESQLARCCTIPPKQEVLSCS